MQVCSTEHLQYTSKKHKYSIQVSVLQYICSISQTVCSSYLHVRSISPSSPLYFNTFIFRTPLERTLMKVDKENSC